MRNVTITLDDKTAEWTRIEAAKRDTSVSRLVGEFLKERMLSVKAYESAFRSYMSRGRNSNLSGGSQYPTREDLHER